MSTDKTEPMGSTSSSPDDVCAKCAHWREFHDQGGSHCRVCHTQNTGEVACGHAFVPADAETAGKPEAPGCIRDAGCRDIFHGCLGGCDAAADELTRLGQEMQPEPEAPEPYTAGWTERLDLGCARPNGCMDKLKRRCGSGLDGCAFAAQLRGERLMPREGPEAPEHDCSDCDAEEDAFQRAMAKPLPRPPFLVAYATGSGALNELALPGEASVAVVDGSLVISHASGVLGIAHVRPLEGP